ncbi:MAG: sulfatase [Rikenellaceae bacterium]
MNRSIYTTMLLMSATTVNYAIAKSAKSVPNEQPNIIFILADDLGWSDIGYQDGSNGFYETPFIDQVSTMGMRMSNFYPGGANSSPSRACLITGMSNVRHKIYAPGAYSKGELKYMRWSVPARNAENEMPFDSNTDVEPSVTSIAEILSDAGYRTARIGKWHLGDDNQGFHEASGDGESDKQFYNDADATRRITNASLKFMEENKNNPFFLYVPFFDVHTPLVAEESLIKKYKEKWAAHEDKSRKLNPIYAAMTEQVDSAVERIFKKLDELGLAENTLVIFASDNGGVGFVTDNAPLRGCKGNLYEGGIRTPAFAIWKGVIKPNTVTTTPVHGLDLMPTLAEISGAKLPKNQPIDGVSVMPLLKGEEINSRPLCWHYPLYLNGKTANGWCGEKIFNVYDSNMCYWRGVPSSAIQKDGWKLIHFYEYDSDELYYLPDDLSEENNLANTNPEKVTELTKYLQAWLKDTNADIPNIKNPMFEGVSETIKKINY